MVHYVRTMFDDGRTIFTLKGIQSHHKYFKIVIIFQCKFTLSNKLF
jgi:hypothetical protein